MRLPLLIASFAIAFPTAAHAYLNPDSGSMLLQALLGGAAGVAVVARVLWRRFSGALRRRDRDPAPRT